MAAGPEQRLTPEDRANLVAYIDGELTEAEAQAIATKLTQSPTARREVESLKKTWELLAYLPRPAASPAFLERTHTAIGKLHTRQSAWQKAAGRWSGAVGKSLAALVAGLALALAGYAGARWAWPDPMERLVRDFSLAEHLEEYREVGSFAFLEELAQSKEFRPPTR